MLPVLPLLRCTVCALLVLYSFAAFPQCWSSPKKLVPTKALKADEGFGMSIDYENNIAVVGAPRSDTLKTLSGVVYLFEFTNDHWEKIASLSASDHRENQYFGYRVLIHDDRIFVSDAARDNGDGNYGAVYIYEKPTGGWHDMVETSILTPTHPYPYHFASSMDISGNKLLVGASSTTNENYVNAGAAFLFELQGDTWKQIATFKSPNALASTFGSNVALAENTAVVVADQEQISTIETGIGATYVFEKNAVSPWTNAYPVARLTGNAPFGSVSYLGHGLCIDESRNTIFVSQVIWSGNVGTRAIEVYEKPATGWKDMTETRTFLGTGTSRISYQTLRVEEPYLYSGGGPQVEIFTPDSNNKWTMTGPASTLQNSNFYVQQQFSWDLCVSDGHVLVSAPALITQENDTVIGPLKPAVYEFIRPATGWAPGKTLDTHSFIYKPITATDYFFGYDIDIDGDIAVVGSRYDNIKGTAAGAVYVYRLENYQWNKVAMLTPSDGEYYDNFGGSVAISGDRIAVAANSKSYRDANGKFVSGKGTGAVYIFKKPNSGWTDMHESYRIMQGDGTVNFPKSLDGGAFGMQIDLNFPYLAVSRFNIGSRPNTGSVVIFNLTNDTPVYEAMLTPSFRDNVNDFGTSICVRDSIIAIGSGATRAWMFDRNYVFMYKRSGSKWNDTTESGLLIPSDNGRTGYLPGIAFGESMDMTDDGSEIIVGAPGWFDGVIFQTQDYFKGAAYIYEKPQNGWTGVITEKAKLTIPNQPAYGCMGVSVHIEDRYVMVGSPQNYWTTNGSQNPGPGKVYFYKKPADGWQYKLPDATIQGDESGSAQSDYFGSSVEGVPGYIMIGAIADDNQGSVDAGSVYVYTEYPFITPIQGVVCENVSAVQLTAIPPGGIWNGVGLTNPTDGIFNPMLAGAGTHTISYTIDGCSAANTVQIEVAKAPHPLALIGRDSLYFCGNATVRLETPQDKDFSYAWSYSKEGGSYASIGTNAAILQADKPGYYKIDIAGGCAAVSGTVWVGDIFPNGGNDFSVCGSDNAYQLTGNYRSGIWSGPGVSPTGLFDPKGLKPGMYELYYTVSPLAGCYYKDLVEAGVSLPLTVSIQSNGAESICYTGTSLLSVPSLPNAQYAWSFGTDPNDLSTIGENSPQYLAEAPGFYNVAVSDGTCATTADYELVLPPFLPLVSPAFDSVAFCADQAVNVTAEPIPNAHYTWLQHTNNTFSIVRESTGSFSEVIHASGTFRLQIESHGCSFESTDLVTWKIPGDSVFIPNVFTPNGDKTNDNFEIHVEGVDDYYISVFNRYGEEVWSGQNGSTPWNAADTSPGVYFWVLSYGSACSSRKEYKGWVQVLK